MRQPNQSPFLAHSAAKSGRVDTVAGHLSAVAKRAARYADVFGEADLAYLAGLLHDLGKYGELFQKRLRGECRGVDHWSIGAWAALMRFNQTGVLPALAVAGHHLGLGGASKAFLADLNPKAEHPLGLRHAEQDWELLKKRLAGDGLELPKPDELATSLMDPLKAASKGPAAAMLDLRFLFSALVDADFIETEAHFAAEVPDEPSYRPHGPALDPAGALDRLTAFQACLAAEHAAADQVHQVRQDLLAACLAAAKSPPGRFTATAPTGSGKTLSLLAFALEHARVNGLKRIIFVIPYLSIIEQTVDVFLKVFGRSAAGMILEDHSLARSREEHSDRSDGQAGQSRPDARLLAENWDAPIIVTTSVQFLESLFANRPAACRKLHRLAQSVVIFDEVQTLPAKLAAPTLAALSRLTERFGASVVFSTATQPAFDHLSGAVEGLGGRDWRPREIVPPEADLFGRTRRTEVAWPNLEAETPWDELAEGLAREERGLVIVNVKRHALALMDRLKKMNVPGLVHLSTNMCPAHRRAVLARVRQRLEKGEPCRLVSTQCVEAGVDLDFPAVFRALAPLEAIAQAAGRCNRAGRMAGPGRVTVFIPEDHDRYAYPDGGYQQAAAVVEVMLREHGGRLDIDDPQTFREYYRTLYDLSRPGERFKELTEAIRDLRFDETARRYRLIDKSTINVLTPYDREEWQRLADQARDQGFGRDWLARARPLAVGLYQGGPGGPAGGLLEAVPDRGGEKNTGWFIYLEEEHYRPDLGLVLPQEMDNFYLA